MLYHVRSDLNLTFGELKESIAPGSTDFGVGWDPKLDIANFHRCFEKLGTSASKWAMD